MLSGRSNISFFAAAVLLAAVIFVFSSLASSATYNYCVGHNGQHYTGQTDQEGSPIVEPVIDNPTPINLFVYCGGIFANENGSGITALATVLLTVVTALLGYLAWDQGRTSKAQLRAYVFVEGTEMRVPEIDVTQRTRVAMHLFNRGQTPAYGVTSWTATGILPNPLTADPPIRTEQAGFTPSDMGPNGKMEIVAVLNRPWTQAEQADVMADTLRFYIFGDVRYTDAFGVGHFTRYRMVLMFNADGSPVGLMMCEEGNKSD